MRKNALALFTFIAFGFGSLPNVDDGGLFVVGLFEKDPNIHPTITSNGIFLFSIEL